MKKVIFNELIEPEIFYNNIIEDFQIVLIEPKKSNGWEALSTLKRTIDTGLVKVGKNNQYLILLDKTKDKLSSLKQMEGIQVYPQSSKMLQRKPLKAILNLLLRAIPRINNGFWENTPIGLEYGLYYISSINEKNGVIKSLGFDIAEENKKLYFNMSQQIFLRGDNIFEDLRKKKQPFILKNGRIQTSLTGEQSSYYMGAFKRKWGKDIPYFDWSKLNQSKIGIIARFLNDIDMYLNRYCRFKLCEDQSFHVLKKKKSELKNTMMQFTLKQQKSLPWNVVPLTKSDVHSKVVCAQIETLTGQTPTVSSNVKSNYFNLLIHEDAQYYLSNKTIDPYLALRKDNPKAVLSSLTVSTIERGLPNAMTVLIKDAYIKNDILLGKISIESWVKRNIIFGMRIVQKKKYVDHLLHVDKMGNLKYLNSLENTEECDSLYEKSITLKKTLDISQNTELFFYDMDTNDYSLIITTVKFPLPEVKKIKQLFDEYTQTRENAPSKKDIYVFAKKFVNLSPDTPSEKSIFIKKVAEWAKNKELNVVTRIGKGKIFLGFYTYLHSKYGLRFTTDGLKGEKGLMGNYFGIFVNNEELEYYVGTINGPKNIIHRNHRVRKIVGNIRSIPEWYLELLEVDFVKNKDITVIPYPYKYLRESIRRWYIINEEIEYRQDALRNILSKMYQ